MPILIGEDTHTEFTALFGFRAKPRKWRGGFFGEKRHVSVKIMACELDKFATSDRLARMIELATHFYPGFTYKMEPCEAGHTVPMHTEDPLLEPMLQAAE